MLHVLNTLQKEVIIIIITFIRHKVSTSKKDNTKWNTIIVELSTLYLKSSSLQPEQLQRQLRTTLMAQLWYW